MKGFDSFRVSWPGRPAIGGGTRWCWMGGALMSEMMCVLHGLPVRAVHAGQLAGVMIPYSWILR